MDPGAVERRMRPGGWTKDGFLKPDASLGAVIDADARRVRALGFRARTLGEMLISLLAKAEGTDIMQPRRIGDVDVEIHRKRGLITCPWAPDEGLACEAGDRGIPTANRFLIVDPRSGAKLSGFALTAHLIAEHGFFGGPGTPYRIEPEDLARLVSGSSGTAV